MTFSDLRCRIIPPYLLERIAASHPDELVRERARSTLSRDVQVRQLRASATRRASATGGAAFVVNTAHNGTDLPGDLVRSAGDPPSGDAAVDEAYSGVEATLSLYQDVFDRSSYDGKGAQVVSTVHYDQDYDNAFWDGSQLVFGDGDGSVFQRFTKPIDVVGHELSHALTEHTANLTYDGQSGALNESVSDAFGSCVKQRIAGQGVDEADWLIGEGIFLPAVQGVALRSMKAPGTAYDDDVLGKDPQVGSMDDYVVTADDNGGVHTNSGIPNRAFYLAATAMGGHAWDGAGRVWYSALTSGIGASTDFAGFAAATVSAARAVSADAETAVSEAWTTVGVLGGDAPAGTAPSGGPGSVSVTRSGGVAGIRRTGEVVLGEDPRSSEVASLLERIDFSAATAHRPRPDRFVFTFSVDGRVTVVGEHDLTPELRQLTDLVLPD